MDRDPRAYLWDVQQAANAIDQFVAGLDAAGYVQNALVRAAVERQFEIIGGASTTRKSGARCVAWALASRSVGYVPRLARFDRDYAMDLAQLVYQLGDGSTTP